MDFTIREIKAPLAIQFELTYECNNYCSFCYNVWKDPEIKEVESKKLLSFEQICAILDQLKNTGVFQITFTGGEPTLHPDFLRILTYATSIGIKPGFVSNANLITSEYARKLKETGVRRCQISLHGSNAEMHESLTQVPGSFDKAINGIKNLINNDFHVNVNMTVSKANMDDMWNTASLVKNLGVQSFSFTRFIYSGSGNAQQEALGIKRDDQDELVDIICRIEDELGLPTRVLTPIPLCSVKEPERIAGKMSKCDGGISWCVITPSGEVRTCTNSSEIAGDLKENTLEEIWKHGEDFKRNRSLAHIPKECLSCKAFVMCGGGCRACAYNFSCKSDYKASDPCSNVSNFEKVNSCYDTIKHKIMVEKIGGKQEWVVNLAAYAANVKPITNGDLWVRQEEFGLLASTGNNYVIVNEHGLEIFVKCDGKSTLQEMVDYFEDKYKQPREEIEKGVVNFLKMLTLMNMVSWIDVQNERIAM